MSYYNIEETAERIRGLRNRRGFTQEGAAELLEIERSSLSRVEKGTKGCSIDLLMRIAETYGTTIDYLLTGQDIDGSVAVAIMDEAIFALSALRGRL